MKKHLLPFLFFLVITGTLAASDFSDSKMEEFFGHIQNEEYNLGLTKLLTGSGLENIVLKDEEKKETWISQLLQINQIYGKFISFEKVFSKKLGNIENTYYFVYHEVYPIQFIITEYDNGEHSTIVNVEFDDKTLETVNTYGKIVKE